LTFFFNDHVCLINPAFYWVKTKIFWAKKYFLNHKSCACYALFFGVFFHFYVIHPCSLPETCEKA
jgi:hypothetical protein